MRVEILGTEVEAFVKKHKERTELVIPNVTAELLPPALISACNFAMYAERGEVTISDIKQNYVVFSNGTMRVNVKGDERDAVEFAERVLASIVVALGLHRGDKEKG